MAESGIELARSAAMGRRRQETRASLVAAAHRLFQERGYEAATVADIVERADSSRATFYLYFSGKEDIYRATAGEFASALAEQFAALDRTLRDGDAAAFGSWLCDQVAWARTSRQSYAIWGEAESVDAGMGAAIWRSTIQEWLGSMPWFVQQWPPGSVEPFTRLGLFVGQIQYFHHDLLTDAERPDALRLLSDMWYRELRRPTTAQT